MTKHVIAVVEDSDTDYCSFLEIIDEYEKSSGDMYLGCGRW